MCLDGFENVRFDPITLTDCQGVPHEFHLRAISLFQSVARRNARSPDFAGAAPRSLPADC
jgi:hypothetical protein